MDILNELYPEFDTRNPKVKKFWDTRKYWDKKFKKWMYGVIFLYALLFVLALLDKLSINLLFVGVFLSFLFTIVLIHTELKDIHNRIEMENDILLKQIQNVHNKITQPDRV